MQIQRHKLTITVEVCSKLTLPNLISEVHNAVSNEFITGELQTNDGDKAVWSIASYGAEVKDNI